MILVGLIQHLPSEFVEDVIISCHIHVQNICIWLHYCHIMALDYMAAILGDLLPVFLGLTSIRQRIRCLIQSIGTASAISSKFRGINIEDLL